MEFVSVKTSGIDINFAGKMPVLINGKIRRQGFENLRAVYPGKRK